MPLFAAGDLLAGRFRVVRLVGQGGMGHVYEAEDLELRDHVALKTVRPDAAHDPDATERFRREINLARRVTHPNVCRIFDLFHHTLPSGATIAFVTMELLPGPTLAERLRGHGRLTAEEALPLAGQMTAALHAAHEAGVLHRDFKPGNVVLVGDGPAPRAVVTDFGLAQAAGSDEPPRGVGGTAAYMAPEQAAGEAVTEATDVYALGVTLYEMVSGHLPFASSLASVSCGVREPPAPLARYAPELDPAWQGVILRCLERSPADRYPGPLAVQRALGAASGQTRRRRALLLTVLAALLLAIAIRGHEPPPAAPASARFPVHARPSVALLGFRNLSERPESAWLSVALSEALAGELAAGEGLRTIPGEEVAHARAELRLGEPDGLGPEALQRIRRDLGADLVIAGTYLAGGPGSPLQLELRVQDTASGRTLGVVSETGLGERIGDVAAHVGRAVCVALGGRAPCFPPAAQPRAAGLPNAAGARSYALGLERLRLFDPAAARDLLEKAVAADPESALAHAALGEAAERMGDEEDARAEAHRAAELSALLSRAQRLSLEARDHEVARRWDKAIGAYRTLVGLFPDDPDYGLRLAAAQVAAGRADGALATVTALRALPPPAGDDPRIDLAEARAAGSLSDFRRQQSAAARAAEKGAARGARHLMARAALEQGAAWWALGEAQRAAAAYERARGLFEEAGDRWGVARALDVMAGIPYEQGDLATARRMFEESLDLSRAIGDSRGAERALGRVAETQYSLGELDEARRTYEEAVAINRAGGARELLADNLYGSALVSASRGELAAAAALDEEAIAAARAIGDQRFAAFAMSGLARVRLEQGDLAGARALQEQTLALRERLGQEETVASSRLALAEIALAEDHPAAAEPLAREAAEVFARERFPDDEAEARAALALALFASRPGEAAAAMGRAASLAARSQNVHVRLRTALAAARFRTRAGEAGPVADVLGPALEQARRLGLVAIELDVRLVLGEAELAAGRTDAGAPRLRALAVDARARGFGRIAGLAAAATDGEGHRPVP